MKKEGLLAKPDFYDIDKYLQSGDRTQVTDEIIKVSQGINGETDGMVIRNILVWMNQHTSRLDNKGDNRKFTRSADEILKSRERTGCCDSSTLFTALARSKGIPSMQIITLGKEWAKKLNKGEISGMSGHYFTACYLKDKEGHGDWILIDSDRRVEDISEVS